MKSFAGPICVGITGDICISCKQTVYDTHKGDPEALATAPLYILDCHLGDELICRDCMVQSWYSNEGHDIPCPWKGCGKNCGIPALCEMNRVIVDKDLLEHTEHSRFSTEVVDHLVSVDGSDALEFLTGIYELFADQVLDPTMLGGAPSFVMDAYEHSAALSVATNPFFSAIYSRFFNEHIGIKKYAMKGVEIESELITILNRETNSYIARNYSIALQALGEDLTTEKGMQKAAKVAMDQFLPVRTLHELWTSIIYTLVNLLCYRHLTRFNVGIDGDNKESE
jgi:hypothetical protein